MDAKIREEAFDGPGAQQLLVAFVAEITALYPTWTTTAGPSAEPDDFKPPMGTFVVVYVGDDPVACGGLKRLDGRAAEIKRLYVSPDVRRRGFGVRVIEELEAFARKQGYAVVRLDTGADQPDALRLFAGAGYREVADYNANPFASHWFEKSLR